MCDCASYNWAPGKTPQVIVPKPEWSSRNGDTIALDACIAPVVEAIWAAGHITLSSCCGHGRQAPGLVLGDGSDATPEIIADIERIIAEVDGRRFTLHQWQLVEVSGSSEEVDL